MSYYEEELDRSKLRYILYARKSSEDEDAQSHSIPAQIADCMRLAEREGINVVKQVEESASAKMPDNRPVFSQMLRDLESGKYDGILCWHPDRLARNMLEAGKVIDMLDNEVIKDLRFFSHQFSNDANGKMLLGMLFVFSKQYSENLSEKVKMGIKHNLKSGVGSGTPRWGYERDEVSGHYKPNEYFDAVREGWMMRAEGKTVAEVIRYYKAHNVHRTTKISRKNKSVRDIYPNRTNMTKMFRSTFYFGVMIQAGQEVDLRKEPFSDHHLPMITEDVYNSVQALTYQRSRWKPRASKKGKFYPFRGMIFCGVCKSDTPMRVTKNLDGSKKYVLNVRCDNPACNRKIKNVRMKYILEPLYKELEKLKLTENEYDAYSKKLEEMTDEKIDEIRGEIKVLEGTKAGKSRQMDDIARSMRKFNKEEKAFKVARRDLEDIEEDAIAIDEELAKLRAKIDNPAKIRMNRQEFLNLVNIAPDKMKAGEAVEKDIIARKMLWNVSINDKRVPSFIWKEPFATLVESRKFHFGARERT